jgi:hypothetical protein
MPATLAGQMLAQKLTGTWIKKPHEHRVPLHVDLPPDPAWRSAIISSFNFDTAVAVGTIIADRPPRGSARAELPHTALA